MFDKPFWMASVTYVPACAPLPPFLTTCHAPRGGTAWRGSRHYHYRTPFFCCPPSAPHRALPDASPPQHPTPTPPPTTLPLHLPAPVATPFSIRAFLRRCHSWRTGSWLWALPPYNKLPARARTCAAAHRHYLNLFALRMPMPGDGAGHIGTAGQTCVLRRHTSIRCRLPTCRYTIYRSSPVVRSGSSARFSRRRKPHAGWPADCPAAGLHADLPLNAGVLPVPGV